VADEAILEAYHRIAELEGIFCEPASAAGVAALRAAIAEGSIRSSIHAVCILTGNGLKDPDRAAAGLSPTALPPDATAIAETLHLEPR
jgi:threonine synthase